MKKILLLALTAFTAMSAFAVLNGDGYYRVQNAYTKRYIYILDNRGSYNLGSTSADIGAIELYLDATRKNSDPATVMYIQNASGSSYDIAAQGTSLHGILDAYVKLYKKQEYEGVQSYNIYASKSGMTKYLADNRSSMSRDKGYPTVDKADDVRRLWYMTPVDANTDEFFGIAPTVTAGGKYYYPLYAGFPVSAKSEGMKFYTVTGVDPVGVVVINEVTGTIPAGVPVIVECSNPLATDNRLNVGVFSDYANTVGNQLSAVYFDNEDPDHYNRTGFNRTSMRVLGVVDGQLAFVRGDYDFIPRNQAYLPLQDAAFHGVDNLLVMTPAQLDAYKAWLAENGVAAIEADQPVDVYTVDGRLVATGIAKTEVSNLPKGLYILRSGTKTEKLLVK